ncbi:MAG: GGDEF domain-containing protein [Terracidiphilus sp.]|jgi:diguanylate cyclase (GGDEF)-like protein
MMKRLIAALVLLPGWTFAAWAAEPATLTSLRAIHALSNAEASHGIPVAFEATVTYYRDYDIDLFVQDGSVAIYVLYKPGAKLLPGDRVLVEGKTQNSFRPNIADAKVTLLRHGPVRAAVPATFQQLVSARADAMRVAVHGLVRAADMVPSAGKRNIYLQVLIDGGTIDAAVNSGDESALKDLLDSEVEIAGVSSAKFDQKMQQTGTILDVQSLADVKILKRAGATPASLPMTPMEDVLGSYHVRDFSQRVQVQGTITYYRPGSAVVLQSGAKSMWIMTMTYLPLRVGDLADASGFPEVRSGYLALTHGEVRDTQVQAPIQPLPVDWWELGMGDNAFNLVSVEGRVVMQAREEAQDEYVLTSNGHLFSAIFRHPGAATDPRLPAMKQVPVGAKVRVTGISMFYSSDPFNGPVASDILLRSFDDISVIANPSWMSIRNLIVLVAVLFVGLAGMAAWGWSAEREVSRKTKALAARTEAEAWLQRRSALLEGQRSQILEDINGTRPLAEIIEQIAELVSFGLEGAPCWCEIADGARLGKPAPATEGVRVIRQEIPTRAGSLLGAIFVALPTDADPAADEVGVLSVGARLVALAIETRRLNADLLHRSEFDQLTDVQNRFSLDRNLDSLIDEARKKAGIFGLIYIDLDDFKQVNDLYGHGIGDLYLREVALRMKRQLRTRDQLARQGGDEFAALVPVVRNRAEVEEIAQRLERCFDEPFELEGQAMPGSASVGFAIYPEDGVTRDSLLSAADTAMYAAKNAKKQNGQIPAEQQNSGFASKDRL